MKKKLSKSIIIACVISLALMTIVLFCVQSIIMRISAAKTAQARTEDVIEELEANDIATRDLVEQLNDEFISKADAFSEMIRLDPAILDNPVQLDEIQNLLNVDELHVTDEYGVIQYGTVPEYFGFDFSQSDQAGEFMVILKDPSIKIAQEAQPNGAEGKYFQYIGVTRRDMPGIVQVGNTPERLQRQIERNSINNVLSSFTVGQSGFVMAISKADDTIAAYPEANLIGSTMEGAGISKKAINNIKKMKSGFNKINGRSVYCCMEQNDDYIIIAALPKSEVYSRRVMLMTIFIISIIIMLAIMVFIINTTVQKTIIDGMDAIVEKMNNIAEGDLEVRMSVSTCPEYRVISNGINSMLTGIKKNMDEANSLAGEQRKLFKDITKISHNIGSYSTEMQNLSTRIAAGSNTQAQTIEKVSGSIMSISDQIRENAESARNASDISNKSMENLNVGIQKLEEMQKAMVNIEEAAAKIESIVKAVEEFTFQTNILALNATVEAARAGQEGKGFAVVASEVRNLANKSAEATKGTAELIYETKSAVDYGKRTAGETAESIRAMMNDAAKSNALIDDIALIASEQAEMFEHISDGISRVSDVIMDNADISQNAERTAESLDEQARSLTSLFEKVTTADSKYNKK